MKYKLPIITGAVLLCLAGAFFYVQTTPYYSIFLFARAVGDHDAETALKYVDVDSLTESMARNLLAGTASRQTYKNVAAAVSMNMTSIKEGVREYLTNFIRSHDTENTGKVVAALGLEGFDVRSLSIAALWRLKVRKENGAALIQFRDKPGVTAKMRKTDGGQWKFVEILIDKSAKE